MGRAQRMGLGRRHAPGHGAVREVARGRGGGVVALPEDPLPRRGGRRDGLGGGGDGGRHEALRDAAADAGADLVRPHGFPRVVLLFQRRGAAAAVLADGGTPLRRICEQITPKICKESAKRPEM